jgi:signal transduction histidine kinase/DNA-binding NarL/FixJ family response regulator
MPDASDANAIPRLSVLVVDDEPAHVEAIRRAFQASDTHAEIRVAGSLRELRELVAARTPDVALVDLFLPDGRALDLLTADSPARPFPVLVMTAHGDQRTAVAAIKAGALDYVVKSPEAFQETPHTVARALREWRLLEEHRTAETALRQSEERFRSLFDSAPMSIWEEDRSAVRQRLDELGHPDGAGLREFLESHPEEVIRLADLVRILEVNQESVAFFGVASKEDLPLRLGEYFDDRSLAAFREEVLALAGGATEFTTEIPIRGPRGEPHDLVRRLRVAPGHERDLGRVFVSFFDISERKRAEAERLELERRLLHGQKLESLGVLAGGIAHDFNNLLMAVLGNLDVALQDLPSGSPAGPSIDQAVRATRRATDLTRQMLAYSGRGGFVVKRLDLNRLVRENAGLLRASIFRNVAFSLALCSGEAVIEADEGQLQQVVMNLIMNASEALAGDAGEVTLATGLLDCDEAYLAQSRAGQPAAPGRFARLEVKDTGCGMDGETLERLFDPFFTTKLTGRGLGMAAVLGIVRGHRGAILLDSAPGRGTTVRVLFPACQGEIAATERRPSAAPHAGAGRVLVVDDDDDVRRPCLALVRRLGFEPVGAADGEEALALLERESQGITCVVLDLTMPGMGGLAAFLAMRRLHPSLPVVLSSGYSEEDAVAQLSGERPDGFLQKPYRIEDLRATIARVLRVRAAEAEGKT